jgi:hypothetical protein
MIRAVKKRSDGTFLLLLGVDDHNIEQLTSGHPIHVEGGPLGIPEVNVMIVHGHTLQDVLDELKANGVEVPVDRLPVVTPGHPVALHNIPEKPKGNA